MCPSLTLRALIQYINFWNALGCNEAQGEVIEATENGWNVRLLASDKVIKVNNCERFVRKARTIATTGDTLVEEQDAIPKKTKQSKDEGLSALDAAYKVLIEIGTSLTMRQITEAIFDKGYCPNLKGATPHLTISSAIQREIKAKGSESRFTNLAKACTLNINEEGQTDNHRYVGGFLSLIGHQAL